MHPADRRHGLDVVASLRAAGVDVGRRAAGRAAPRRRQGSDRASGRAWPTRSATTTDAGSGGWRRSLPGFGPALERLRTHAEISAGLAATAGCPPRTVELIRYQEAPIDPEFGELLRLADEAN